MKTSLSEWAGHAAMVAALVVAALGSCDGFAQVLPADPVKRGEYLARAGDCISCHTEKGSLPFAGGRRLNTPFGYMLSPNITPDLETGIGNWSADDFYRAMHHGVNRRGQDMYPVMPYDFYTKMTREDVDAIFAYLKAVKPALNTVDTNHLHFPFSLRKTMAVWRELYFTEGTFSPVPTKSAAWNRGAYLVEGLGHCSDCHSPRNLLGGIEKNRDFSGAGVDGWFALDLTSDIATGLGSWSIDDIATYLKTGAYKGKTTVFGPMAEVVQNSTSHMSDADLKAMAEYLKSIPPEARLRTGRPVPDATRQKGATLYSDNCSPCHQSLGRGIPGVFPPLTGNGVVVASDPTDIFNVVLGGLPAQGTYVPMPSFAGQLTDQDIADIINYIRTSWGNAAQPNATAAAVAKLRATMPKAK
ncbi:MAG: c-type cytochrome [Nitrospiraceae bacterium]